ncbi:MAG: thioredoxin family protein [Bacteroidota bacterium]|nr:thioredoxin family protein [Bacteroidota bacterium]
MSLRISFAVLLIGFGFPGLAKEHQAGAYRRDSGILFERRFAWDALVAKAKAEKKCIFIDCYASWCQPCRRMDTEVYPQFRVGNLMNERFISAKVQMDTTNKDNDDVKASYFDAHELAIKYKVNAFPTFLFFDSQGRILNMSLGFVVPDDFIKVAIASTDSSNNYYLMLQKYKEGARDFSLIKRLAEKALILLNDTGMIDNLIGSYFGSLHEKSWLSSENIEFLKEMTFTSRNFGFKFFFNRADQIDSVMHDPCFAQDLVYAKLYKELLNDEPKLMGKGVEPPDWNRIYKIVQSGYNGYYADRIVTASKVTWYFRKKEYPHYLKEFIKYIDKYTVMQSSADTNSSDDFAWNSRAWQVFKYSTDKYELSRALEWSSHAMTINPMGEYIDTYANILYKLGASKQAIAWEAIAVKQSPYNEEMKKNLELMERGSATWELYKESAK